MEVPAPIPYNAVLCRYGEIALKGLNRSQFERRLVDNIRRVLPGVPDLEFVRDRSRFVLTRATRRPFTAAEQAALAGGLQRVFGLTSFSLGFVIAPTLAALEELLLAQLPPVVAAWPGAPLRYRMRARRSNKRFPLTSNAIEVHFADVLLGRFPKLKLNLDEADLTVWVEVREPWIFACLNEVRGPGGLPCGSSSPVLALLSGGIDSPVASYLMMGRGCRVDFVTFHSQPYTAPELLAKVGRLVQTLNQYQPSGRLFACNLLAAQKAIRDRCSERFRTVLYRRLMFRVADALAGRLGSAALVTGESVGQVASQTVPNLDVINQATRLLVLRPLVGLDKEKTTAMARAIGTFALSAVPCADSCTVFLPRRPATRCYAQWIAAEEAKLDLAALLRDSLATVGQVAPHSGVVTPVPWFAPTPPAPPAPTGDRDGGAPPRAERG